MATLNDVLKLQGTVPGINITQTIDSYSKKPIIRISFRKAAFEGGQRSTLDPRQFDYTPEGFKNAIKHFKKLKTKYKDSIAKIGTVTSATFAKEYSQKKLQFADDLINKIDELTKDPANKTIKQVESKLFKAFNIPKYTKADKGVDPRNAFFQPDKKFFSVPRDYEIYGGAYGKKKISENQIVLGLRCFSALLQKQLF